MGKHESFLRSHDLAELSVPGVVVEKRPARTPDGGQAAGLYNAWIRLDNPEQYNSYTTEMVKGVILAFRAASNARDVNCVVFTGSGDKAFCTGGNTREYAKYYAGRPQEYRQYMRLFNDMVSAILACDKPVICRVNGMRIGGGQEIGMACDFSVAQDLARFGQAGPKHGFPLLQRLAGLAFSEHLSPLLVVDAVELHQRIGDELAVDLQRRDDVGEHAHEVGFMG